MADGKLEKVMGVSAQGAGNQTHELEQKSEWVQTALKT